MKENARHGLIECNTIVLRAEIHRSILHENPNIQILLDAIRLRFSRRVASILSPDASSVSDGQYFELSKTIERILILLTKACRALANDSRPLQMRIPQAYDQTPDPKTRNRLHNVLTKMGNAHKNVRSLTGPLTDRTKPVVSDPAELENLLSETKSLEQSDPISLPYLSQLCSDELNQIGDEEDLKLLQHVAADDKVLGEALNRRPHKEGHVYKNNTAKDDAKAQYGDSIYNSAIQALKQKHQYEDNEVKDKAKAHYGDMIGGKFFFD